MGHGPEAAAVMVQLRTAAHILAGRALPPGEILRSLDSIVAQLPGVPSFATCITTIIDPASGSCLAAQAGHLPPVLVRPGGQTEVLDLPTGLPLGLGADSFDAIEVPFPPGTTLALYTDGLVENRSRPIEGGLAALCDALSTELSKPGRDLDEACEAVAHRLREGGEDDVTLVLARIRQPADADGG
jgi:serine phosphatase RsbU (regulator of sigma subunit)